MLHTYIHTRTPCFSIQVLLPIADPLPQSFKALPWNDSWDVPDLCFAVSRLGYFPGEEIFHEILMADGTQDTEAQRGETTTRGTVDGSHDGGSGVRGCFKSQTMIDIE